MEVRRLYRRLGIEQPRDIDLELVAHYLGLSVKVAPLEACEARIIGLGERGIITVSSASHPRRRRFSIGHEIGHWVYHRGKALICRSDDIGSGRDLVRHREKIADSYASNLLLPDFMLKGYIREKRLNFKSILEIADEFDVSVTATARKIVEAGDYPCLLISYGRDGRKWFVRSPLVPEHWFPQKEIDPESATFDGVFGNKSSTYASKIGADAFFDRSGAAHFEVLEESFCISAGDVLTLVTVIDAEMLRELDFRRR